MGTPAEKTVNILTMQFITRLLVYGVLAGTGMLIAGASIQTVDLDFSSDGRCPSLTGCAAVVHITDYLFEEKEERLYVLLGAVVLVALFYLQVFSRQRDIFQASGATSFEYIQRSLTYTQAHSYLLQALRQGILHPKLY